MIMVYVNLAWLDYWLDNLCNYAYQQGSKNEEYWT